jgi:hypothetical protein
MKNSLVSLALLTVVSGTAFGHQVFDQSCDDSAAAEASATRVERTSSIINAPGISNGRIGIGGATTGNKATEASKCYASTPEANSLRGETPNTPETDRTAALTFCRMGGYANTVDCAKDIIDKGLADDATNCLNNFQRASKKFDLVSHQIGSAAVGKGYWHENYETSKDEGTHRHNYSEPLRKAAANKFIAEQIAYERERRALNSHSTSTSTTENTARGIEGNVGDSKGIVGINGSRTVENGSDKTTTFETGSLTQSEIKAIEDWAGPYAINNPSVAGYDPDIFCKIDEPYCKNAKGDRLPNNSYQPQIKTPESQKEESRSTTPPPKRSSENSDSPHTPTKSASDNIDNNLVVGNGGTWAGEPSKPSDGSLWADFGQDDPGNNPLGNCIFDAHREKIEHGTDKTYDNGGSADTRTQAQKKRDAETLLQKGICDEQYFGRDYCTNWKKKRELIDSAPDVLDDKGPVIAPGHQRERPGYLHFDQDSLPIIVPDLGPNVVPGASGGNTKIPKFK